MSNFQQDFVGVFKRWNDFKGRSRRREYWMFTLYNTAIVILLSILDNLLFKKTVTNAYDSSLMMTTATPILSGLYGLISFVPSLALSIRRMHDTNRSGWFLLLNLIPFVGPIIVLVFAATDGTPGTNKWGNDPKGRNQVNL